MKKNIATMACACLLVIGLGGCETATDTTGGGGVLLSVTDFDGLPLGISVNTTRDSLGGFVQVEEITISSVAKEPNGIVSDLMNVEMRSYEVSYTRADTGSRLPITYTQALFAVVPVNGDFVLENGSVTGPSQIENTPLSDLLAENGGFDTETGFDTITLNLHMRFFGRTLSGDPVQSSPASFTVVFTP